MGNGGCNRLISSALNDLMFCISSMSGE
jgi:hypothetical protein